VAEVKSEDVDGRIPLWHAISSANEFELHQLLNTDNIVLDEQIGFGETPLTLAVTSENKEIVKMLLDTERINVNQPNAHGEMPILLAVRKENSAIVELLLKTCKVKLVPKNVNDQDLLLYAAQNAVQDFEIFDTFSFADYAAGVDSGEHNGYGFDRLDTPINKLANKYPSYLILKQRRQYTITLGLKFASHRAREPARS
jgi:hypothetical protein